MQVNALLIDAKEGAALLSVSERSFHNMRKRKDFPHPVSGFLASRIVRWRRSDLEAFVVGLPTASIALAEPPQLQRGRVFKAGHLVGASE